MFGHGWLKLNFINEIDIDDIYNDVIKSDVLGKSTRRKKFFYYLLEKNAVDETTTISAYGIALDVFDRSEDFDASTDSIVRAETHRLRNRLELYNGKAYKYEISLPKGGFGISVRDAPEIGDRKSVGVKNWKLFPFGIAAIVLILVLADGILFGRSSQQACAAERPNIFVSIEGTTNTIETAELAKFVLETSQAVIQQQQTFHLLEAKEDCPNSPTYGLKINIFPRGKEVYLSVTGERNSDNKKLFNSIHRVQEVSNNGNDVFGYIVSTIGTLVKPDGLLSIDTLDGEWMNELAKTNMTCWVGTYTAGILDKNEDFDSATQCLEYVSQKEQAYPENLALLAYMYVLQDIGAFPNSMSRVDTIDNLIERGKKIDSIRHELLGAELFAETKKSDRSNQKIRDLSMRIGSEFPLVQAAQLQRLLTMSYTLGEWKEGVPLYGYMNTISNQRDNSMLLFKVGYDLLYESPETALKTAIKQYSVNNIHSNLNLLASANFVQNKKHTDKAREALARLGLNSIGDYIKHIESRRFEPKITAKLIAGVSIEAQ